MGGLGSGRHWRYGAKETVESYHELDVRRWQRDGMLQLGRGFHWQWTRNGAVVWSIVARVEADGVILSYPYQHNGGEWENLNCWVTLATTPCNYGGIRYWFCCPAVGCCRRVAIIYLGDRYPACRHCLRLAYRTQSENSADRALTKAQRIRKKLGGSANMMTPFPFKPKWMHWRTYEGLRARAEAASEFSMASLTLWCERRGLLRRA